MAGVVHVYGKEAVLQIFDNKNVEAWSIWSHKQFVHKGYGRDELESFLDMLCNGASNSIYTLKVYEDITDIKKIKEKTECDGSYNFRLDEQGMTVGGFQQYRQQHFLTLDKRLENLERMFLQSAEEEEQDDPPAETLGSILIDILKDPVKTRGYIDTIRALFNNSNNAAPQLPNVNVIGNTMGPGNSQTMTEEQKIQRLGAAIDILDRADPYLTEHLEKLAMMAQDNPEKLKTLLSMLDNF